MYTNEGVEVKHQVSIQQQVRFSTTYHLVTNIVRAKKSQFISMS